MHKYIEHLEEINKFLETFSIPGLNHEEIEKLNSSITNKDIESVISDNKSTYQDNFTGEFYQTFK